MSQWWKWIFFAAAVTQVLGMAHTRTAPVARPVWTFSRGPGGLDDAVADDGRVFVIYRAASESALRTVHVHGLDMGTGRQLWEKPVELAGRFRSQGYLTSGLEVVADAGQVYFVAVDERVHALDGATGRELWQSGPVFSFLGAEGGRVYVVGADRHLAVLDGKGAVVGRSEIRGDESTRLHVRGGRLYVTSPGLKVLDRQTLRVVWSSELRAMHVLVGATRVYVQDGAALHALDNVSGREVWKVQTASPAQAEDREEVFFTELGGVSGLDAKSGIVRRKVATGPVRVLPYGGLIVSNGMMFGVATRPHNAFSGITGSADSALCAVEEGRVVWCSDWRFEYLHAPMLHGNMLFVGSTGEGGRNSVLYAFAGR